MELGLSGLASGFDWQTLVDQLTEVERAPQRRMRTEQTKLQQINNSYSSVKTQLSTLKLRIDALKETSLFDSRTTKVSDSALASATAAPGTPSGSYIFNILQLATTSKQRGGNDAGARLNASNNVSGLVLSNAGFAVGVTAGTFSVNGQQVTIATSDTLQAVFDKISTATGGTVTGSYDSATDKITLSSPGTITLGSAVDTSNFLQVAKLYNNGTNSIASSSALGVVKLDSVLNAANFATAISDGGSGAGEFKINGVSISFNASTEKVSDIIKKIN
ncbi:MAG: flagellar cap protein FliD N-terminal domain-containing protein, partial [Verrucomicrobiota bacterium]